MNKIAILTFLSDNYGTCLQAYALKKAIERLGHTADILKIDRNIQITKLSIFQRITSILSDFPNIFPTDIIRIKCAGKRKRNKFNNFKINYIKPSDKTIHTQNELISLESEYELFIAGSDMVWSTEFFNSSSIFFLSGIPYNKSGSYAPSFGSTNLTKSQQEIYTNYLKDIKYLSCREISGIQLIKKLTGRLAVWTVDPTVLFTAEDWINMLKIEPLNDHVHRMVLVNCFGQIPKDFKKQLVKIQKKSESNEIRYLNTGRIDMKEDLKYGSADYGPIEFVSLMSKCNYSIVNGYHGFLFSLIFEKPFLLLHREKNEHWSKHEDRMNDLVKYLNLEDRYVWPTYDVERINNEIDYENVRYKLSKLRQDSWNYLSEMLKTL